jgi:hypothetical protein
MNKGNDRLKGKDHVLITKCGHINFTLSVASTAAVSATSPTNQEPKLRL